VVGGGGGLVAVVEVVVLLLLLLLLNFNNNKTELFVKIEAKAVTSFRSSASMSIIPSLVAK
jgi:hypothetical protein